MEPNIPLIQAIDDFYRKKNAYETNYYDNYVKHIVSSNISKQAKRKAFTKLPPPKCINCERNVGSIFSIKSKDNAEKLYSIKCGDRSNPCPLDIVISKGPCFSLYDEYHSWLDDLDEVKLEIIKEKNNSIFFSESVQETFDKLRQKMDELVLLSGTYFETDRIRNHNPEKEQELRTAIEDFSKDCVFPFKEMLKEYDSDNNDDVLRNAMKLYFDNILPKLKEIQALKYDVNLVELLMDRNINSDSKCMRCTTAESKVLTNNSLDYRESYHLIQLPISNENKEYCDGSKDINKVIKYVTGTKTQTKTTTTTTTTTKPKIKTKTLKHVKPLANSNKTKKRKLVLEDDDSANDEGKDELVTTLLQNMPEEMKPMWEKDAEWADAFITCMQEQKAGIPCTLQLPPGTNTLLPSQSSSNTNYDFGSDIVNYMFNKLSSNQQQEYINSSLKQQWLLKMIADNVSAWSKGML